MTQYYAVYERGPNNSLYFIMDWEATSGREAKVQFKTRFGDNYGKIVVLPHMFLSQDYSFEYEGS